MNILISLPPSLPRTYAAALHSVGERGEGGYLPRWHSRFDGLILAGGGDVDPAFFGQTDRGSTHVDRTRDRCELALLESCVREGKPVLAICRGHQLVNVWAGGTLIQDLGALCARHQGERLHAIVTTGGSVLRSLYGPSPVVNSSHHQAVARVGGGLWVTALSADGVVEAMEHRHLPILTAQFHPERLPDRGGKPLFRHFLHLCRCISRGQRI